MCSVYSMGDGSSNVPKLFPTGKKVNILAFFIYFFVRHSKKFGYFLTKSVGFLLRNHRNLSKMTQISRRQLASRFYIYFFFFLRKKKKALSGSVAHIIYCASPYDHIKLFLLGHDKILWNWFSTTLIQWFSHQCLDEFPLHSIQY